MTTKLSVLISSIATIALVLVLGLSQSSTNPIGAIHELSVAEMEAITGTGTCQAPVTIPERYDPPASWGCNVDTNCVYPNSAPCGTDYTYYYKTAECSGATIQNTWACTLEDTADPEYTQHDCHCKKRWGQDKCKDRQTDATSKAKVYKADIYHWCSGPTTT